CSVVVGIAGDVEDLLVCLPAGIDPALDDLHALEWRSGRRRRPGIGEREDAEARAPAPPDAPDVTAHGYAAVVRRRDQVGVAAAEIRLASAEEAEDGARAAQARDLCAAHPVRGGDATGIS